MVTAQVYCQRCRETKFVPLEKSDIPSEGSGLKRKSLLHGDHILLVDLDTKGVIRSEQVVDILLNPLQTLINDVAQGFLFLNHEAGKPIHIDVYTQNINLSKFFQNIISSIFDQAIGLDPENRIKLKAETYRDKTVLIGKRLHINVGPYVGEGMESLQDPQKGIILDIAEAERNKLDIEVTFEEYDWVAIMVPPEKQEGYTHAFSSMFEVQKKPFFIDTLSNSSLRQLFDFVLAVTYDPNFRYFDM